MSKPVKVTEGVPPSKTTLCEESESQASSPRTEQKREGSSTPSVVSLKSDMSMGEPVTFSEWKPESQDPPSPSVVSLGDMSMGEPVTFSEWKPESQDPPSPSVMSLGDMSMGEPVTFNQKDAGKEFEHEKEGLPSPSVVSLKSDMSMGEPVTFSEWKPESQDPPSPSVVSMGDMSMGEPVTFNQKDAGKEFDPQKEGPPLPAVSLSGMSMGEPVTFKRTNSVTESEADKEAPPSPTALSPKKNMSMGEPVALKRSKDEGKRAPKASVENKWKKSISKVPEKPSESSSNSEINVGSIFKLLEESLTAFMKSELKKFENILSTGYQGYFGHFEEEEMTDETNQSSKEALLKLTVEFLRKMEQEELAISLQNRTLAPLCRCKLKSSLKQKFQFVIEGTSMEGYQNLNQMYTELCVTEGGTSDVIHEHEVRLVESAPRKRVETEKTVQCKDMFKVFPGRDKPTRTVMTKGVAGIGKTVLTQKFSLDWAEGKAYQEMQFIFPFTFRELNLLKKRKFSLVELVQHFFTETKDSGIHRFEEFQVLFIFDSLDECRFPLDFHNNEILTDVTTPTSVDVLLTNLLRGEMLPSAHIWITTRPAAANQIPSECIDLVTEVRGFIDLQKEEYFRKRFRDEKQAKEIISHIKTSRVLHVMCHIPVFCWITATVLEDVLKTKGEEGNLPSTVTELYIDFLVVQSKLKNMKYDGGAEADPHWSPQSKEMIMSLGKLAFDQLQKGNLIFYDWDLEECGLDVKAASLYSGVFTQIFKEERGLYQDKVFCFVHLSVQEFLAALYVHLTFFTSGINLLSKENPTSLWSKFFGESPEVFYQNAVDMAIQSPNGHLDLFLRFLLGLSVKTNQFLLKGLLTETGNSSEISQKTAQYIKKRINENLSSEKSINLFHCLNEVKDSSLVSEIQQSLRSGNLSTDKLSPIQWSALVFILLSSEKDLEHFDLTEHSSLEEAFLNLLPVVKASKKARLSGCNLTERSCEALASVLSSRNSLRELDLSNNDLKDAGVKLLCKGLESPHCSLEVLRLSGCLITKEGCTSLASAQRSSHLKELNLSYNNLGNPGVKRLKTILQKKRTIMPGQTLELRVEPAGLAYMKPGLKKYACELTPDLNTANRQLIVSENNRKLSVVKEKQPYPEDPQRFSYWKQVLYKTSLTGRCYWEVEWSGHVYVAVTYEAIKRKGQGDDCCLGRNDQSWSLSCSPDGYTVLHNNERDALSAPISNRVGVYLDFPAGTLSFYKISDKATHLHTFHTTFSKPVYPAFRIRMDPFGSSVTLCQI